MEIRKLTAVLMICFFMVSCNKDDDPSLTLNVNHFKQTAIGAENTLVFLVQENDKIGAENWDYYYGDIEGFDYELGYIYSLNVTKKNTPNPPSDGTSFSYKLQSVISKTSTNKQNTFQITLKSVSKASPPSFVMGNKQEGFTLLNEVNIDCNLLCDELSDALVKREEVNGLFSHKNSNTITLVKVLTK